MVISSLMCCFCWDHEGPFVLLFYKTLTFLENVFTAERPGWLLWKVRDDCANATGKFMILGYL